MLAQSSILWKAFRTGDKLAYGQLMHENYKHLLNYGSKFSTDNELVKDVIQELFLKLWEKRLNLSDDVNPRAYLSSSLRRALHRRIQSLSRFSSYSELNELESCFEIVLSVEQNFIEEESTRNLAIKIAKKMSDLPSRQREVVYLKFFQDFSRDEISETMQITPQTVSNLLQLALKKLRVRLNSEFVVCVGVISSD